MKNLLFALLAALVLFSCQPDPEVTPLNSEIQLSLGDIYFGESGANGGRVNAITWSHVLGGTGSITFDNQDNDYSATYPVDGSNLGAGSYTIPNGTYDISLDMNSATPADFIPYTASLSSQVISGNQTLTFDANTSFGLVLLGLDSLDQTVTPSFNVSGTDYDLTLDAVQEFYYLYVPGAATGTLTATETFYDQSLSVDVNVTTSTIHAYAFKVVTSDAGISVNFADFTVEENDWNIDGVTVFPNYALEIGTGGGYFSSTLLGGVLVGRNVWTIEFWVKLAGPATGAIMFNFGTNLPNSMQILPDGSLFFNADSGNFGSVAGGWPNDANWHHVVVGMNGGTNGFFYIDGVAITMAGNNVAQLNGGVNQDLRYGSIGQVYSIDEFRIWQTARNSTEINTNLNVELVGNEADLLAYFNFNDGTGSATAQNLAGSANGTLNSLDVNTSWVVDTPF